MISTTGITRLTLALLPGALLVLGGCLGGDKDSGPQPAELVQFDTTLKVRRAWSAKVGGSSEFLRLGLRPAGAGTRVYAAAMDGTVAAFDAASGKSQWVARTALPLSAGPGLGPGMLVVGASDGQVAALNSADGVVIWRTSLNGEILAAPAVTQTHVIVRTVDGTVRGLSALDGSELWSYEQRLQGLTLRGNASPVVENDIVYCAFDNGTIASIDITTGELLWESAMTERRGRTELERIADVDADLMIRGRELYAVGYNSRALRLGLDTGRTAWARDISSYNALAADYARIYISTAADELVALDRGTGTVMWTQSDLTARQLSPPAVLGEAVVVGDFEGYLHWVSASDGKFIARNSTDGGAITTQPLVLGGRVFVQTDRGDLLAFAPAEGG